MQTEYMMDNSLSKQRSNSEHCLINIFQLSLKLQGTCMNRLTGKWGSTNSR